MTERVTVEQNGERFTLEVPDGTSDAEIQSFLSQQQTVSPSITEAGGQPAENIAGQAGIAAARPAMAIPSAVGAELGSWKNIAPKIGYQGAATLAKEFAQHPIDMAKKLGSAYIQGHSIYGPIAQEFAGKTAMQGAGALGRGAMSLAGSALAAPENALTLPYNMAAYEQAKIRENPTAPQYQNNPYAQVVRGEAATQGRAGAANQMKAVANMPYGNVSPQERAMLEQDQQMRTAIRKKAFEKVMGPVAPGSF